MQSAVSEGSYPRTALETEALSGHKGHKQAGRRPPPLPEVVGAGPDHEIDPHLGQTPAPEAPEAIVALELSEGRLGHPSALQRTVVLGRAAARPVPEARARVHALGHVEPFAMETAGGGQGASLARGAVGHVGATALERPPPRLQAPARRTDQVPVRALAQALRKSVLEGEAGVHARVLQQL